MAKLISYVKLTHCVPVNLYKCLFHSLQYDDMQTKCLVCNTVTFETCALYRCTVIVDISDVSVCGMNHLCSVVNDIWKQCVRTVAVSHVLTTLCT